MADSKKSTLIARRFLDKIQLKAVKFLIVGLSAAFVNLFFMVFFVEVCHFNTFLLKNVANVMSIFISVIYNFILSRSWTWSGVPKKQGKGLLAQFISFNVVNLITTGFRVVLFGVFEKNGINYILNVIIGIISAAVMSFVLYDKLVFKRVNVVCREKNEK